MNRALIHKVETFVKSQHIPVMGAASAAEINKKAPPGFRPEDLLTGAKTVIILAKPLPLAVFLTDDKYKNMFYVRSFATYYAIMDKAANVISLMLEAAGYLSLPVPSYSPIRFYDGEPRGLLSLKHAAEIAGLGKMGKNTLLIHPEYGNLLRLGGLVTTMDWPVAEKKEFPGLCPASCNKCEKACPVGALDNRRINKSKCLGNCIQHMMIPSSRLLSGLGWLLARNQQLTDFMERFTYNFIGNYGINCKECLVNCIHFPKPGRKKAL